MATMEPITVGMRLRPLVGYEQGQTHCIAMRNNVVSIVGDVAGDGMRDFAFDVAMDSTDPSSPDYVGQEKCYELMGRRMLEHMVQGYNTCLFCYGQTGTGKTTTIMGKAQPVSEQGLLLRLINDIFEHADQQRACGSQVHLSVQMLEVYNEKLQDLLVPGGLANRKGTVDIHVHPVVGVYLTGAVLSPVENMKETITLIEYGNTMKTVHATAMNAQSSRGHTIFKLNMERKGGSDNMTLSSEVYFADLAGRENERTTRVTGDRFQELTFINKSLHWLAQCIQSLGGGDAGGAGARRKTVTAIPKPGAKPDMAKFRNSKLTLLLSNALSGNSRTAMIGTLSPAVANFEESYSTLKFAATVKNIKLEAKAATAVDKDVLVRKLEDEVKELKRQLELAAREKSDVDVEDIASKLQATEAIAAVHARDWTEVQRESKEYVRLRSRTMEQLGALEAGADHPYPYIANYAEDPSLAFKLVLHVPEDGQERTIGSGEGNFFRLPPGLGVAPRTGFISNCGGKLRLRAAEVPAGLGRRPASIEVNCVSLDLDPVELKHLDCIIFGRSTTFYAFLMPTPPEVLLAKVFRKPEVSQQEELSMEALINAILGQERSADPVQVQLARKYCTQLQQQHRDSEGAAVLRAFMHSARVARKKVEEANDITEAVRPETGISFELVMQAPVLAFGFDGVSNLPELGVRLVRKVSRAKARWRVATRAHRGFQLGETLAAVQQIAKGNLIVGQGRLDEDPTKSVELLSTWTWAKFTARLDMMHDVYSAWTADPGRFKLDPASDAWAEHGPAEFAELQQEHKQEVQELRQKVREGEQELVELRAAQRQLAAERDALRRDLQAEQATRAQLAAVLERGQSAGKQPVVDLRAVEAVGQATRCLEFSKANNALLQKLLEVQNMQGLSLQ